MYHAKANKFDQELSELCGELHEEDELRKAAAYDAYAQRTQGMGLQELTEQPIHPPTQTFSKTAEQVLSGNDEKDDLR